MRKPAVHRRRLTLIGGLTGLGLVATLGLAAPPAAGAQTGGHHQGFAVGTDGAIYVSNCSIAPASGMGPKLCPAGGQVVRIG